MKSASRPQAVRLRSHAVSLRLDAVNLPFGCGQTGVRMRSAFLLDEVSVPLARSQPPVESLMPWSPAESRLHAASLRLHAVRLAFACGSERRYPAGRGSSCRRPELGLFGATPKVS